MTMEQILTEIRRCRQLAEMNPADYPSGNRAGFQIAARQAKDALPGLEREYVEALIGRSVTVALAGPRSSQATFSLIAIEEGLTLIADVGLLYQKIATKVLPSIGNDQVWSASQHSLAIQYALHEAVDLGFKEMGVDNARPFVSLGCSGLAEGVEHVRRTIIDRLGHDIARVWVRSELTRQAVLQGIVPSQAVGVLILGAASREEAVQLLHAWPSAGDAVEVTGIPQEDDVMAAFERLFLSSGESLVDPTPSESTEQPNVPPAKDDGEKRPKVKKIKAQG